MLLKFLRNPHSMTYSCFFEKSYWHIAYSNLCIVLDLLTVGIVFLYYPLKEYYAKEKFFQNP